MPGISSGMYYVDGAFTFFAYHVVDKSLCSFFSVFGRSKGSLRCNWHFENNIWACASTTLDKEYLSNHIGKTRRILATKKNRSFSWFFLTMSLYQSRCWKIIKRKNGSWSWHPAHITEDLIMNIILRRQANSPTSHGQRLEGWRQKTERLKGHSSNSQFQLIWNYERKQQCLVSFKRKTSLAHTTFGWPNHSALP